MLQKRKLQIMSLSNNYSDMKKLGWKVSFGQKVVV